MKMSMGFLCGIVAGLTGCATYEDPYSRYDRHYSDNDVVIRTGDREVILRDDRTYVRDYENNRYENRLLPRYRGKHPDSLGWNDPPWYR